MGILVARTRLELRAMIASLKSTLKDGSVSPLVGFVPTMGALHEGHATLIRQSAQENAITVVSIFVNPKQFGPSEDLGKYPRAFEADCALCEKSGAQVVFAPTVEQMYPAEFKTTVNVNELGDVLCGFHRPGHFSGVCTVVLLLLNLVAAENAYFGLKDYQQFAIISRMVEDLELQTRVIGVPTVRETDGLALSSRNQYLDAKARRIAACVPTALRAAVNCFLNGDSDASAVMSAALRCMKDVEGFEVQYCELRNAKDLSEVIGGITHASVLAIAGFVQGADGVRTRLIDNIILSHEPDRRKVLLDFSQLAKHSN